MVLRPTKRVQRGSRLLYSFVGQPGFIEGNLGQSTRPRERLGYATEFIDQLGLSGLLTGPHSPLSHRFNRLLFE